MDWYELVFELIDMRSFSNLWYWIALAAVWSSASHWILGVPYDMVARAARHGGRLEADLEALVRINVGRRLYIARVAGTGLVSFGFMVHTGLLILGFWYGVEFAQAVLLIALPMTLVTAISLRVAERIERKAPEGDALRAELSRLRLAIQAIGIVSIFVTALWGMYRNLDVGPFAA
ncbi:component of SufBCD complex [Rhodobacteraceae bacterium CCMM004]|nr:component of SufBCD complex [Rhodobacteraceae bacterium CCMM004]